ncbi:Plastocyanin [Halomicrobium zhouii]|uniref:Plastocyanin n=1 Tax=Halomicrobium zhouii TaxID=767519 RepID=A0A1I6LU65_9EURY|nr:plastocyanin/azurin family copper-binding protein [Halomicrobium zhouii]SFS06984.1 Plastocyanin [Halomicrobium zhouii]
MKRRHYIRTIGTGACVGLTGLAGCGSPDDTAGTDSPAVNGDDTETTVATGGDTEADGESNTVAMITDGDEYYFDPIGIAIDSGGTVTWNNESGSHSTTAYVEGNPQSEVTRIPEDAEGWNSETLTEQGATFSHTFDVEGTYDYYCIPHKSLEMVGRVVVGEPSGLGDDPPDGAVPDEQTIVDAGTVSYDEFQSG